MRFTLIAVGGALGALLRYVIGGWIQSMGGTRFPWGTLAVNVLGSFVLGYLLAFPFASTHGFWDRHFWAIGIIGAFTTYSAFTYETIAMLSVGDWTGGVMNILGNVLLGLGAALLGLRLGAL